MNKEIFFLGLLQFGLSLVIGVVLLYITFRTVQKRVGKKHKLDLENVAYCIFCASILFSAAYLVEGIKEPLLTTLRFIKAEPALEGSLFVEMTKYIGVFVGVSITFIALVNVLSVFLFTSMTRGIDEFKEIAQGNVGVGIITGVIVIAISFLVKDSMVLLLESFIPYPDIPRTF